MASGVIKSSNSVYFVKLNADTTVSPSAAHNAEFLSLNIPSGKFIILIYNHNADSMPVWIGYDDVMVDNQSSDLYCIVINNATGCIYHTFSNPTKLSLHNASGRNVTFYAATRIIAIKL